MTSTDHTRPPGRPRSAEVDAAILRAALDLLVERGIDATSIERVAQRAGVTRATIYRRFADKTELLIAAIHSGYDVDLHALPEPEGVEQMLSWWARALGDTKLGPGPRLMRRLMTSLYDHPQLRQAFERVSIEPRNRWILATLEKERERGNFPPDTDLDVVREILTGALASYLLRHPDGGSVTEIESHLLAVLAETRYRRKPTS